MLRHREFDICELSLSSYLLSRASADEYPFTAIPVFPHRLFRHSYMFKHAESAVSDPADLTGKNVGLKTWQATSGVWMRGITQEKYGLDLTGVTWYIDDTEDIPLDIPKKFNVKQVPPGKDMEKMLQTGEIESAMYPVIMDAIRDPESSVERIFSNYKSVETKYYRETDIFPMMHTVVVRDEVLEQHPWVAVDLYEAFIESRDYTMQQLEDPRTSPFVWPNHHYEKMLQIFDGTPWEYGLTKGNRAALSKLQDYAESQEIVPHPYDVNDLFFHTTLDDDIRTKGYVSGSHN